MAIYLFMISLKSASFVKLHRDLDMGRDSA